MDSELQRRLDHLDGLTELHSDICTKMLKADSGNFYPLDLLAGATIKRSMALIQGFTILSRIENYSCASSLLRLQLDSCIRLYAAFIVEKPHELAHEVLKGNPIRNMKDMRGNKMTDRYLVESLSEKYEWMPRVYKSCSGFIHLSEKHLFSIVDYSENDKSIGLRVSADDKKYPSELWIELADAFLHSTDILFEYLKGWIYTKENPELVSLVADEIVRANKALNTHTIKRGD